MDEPLSNLDDKLHQHMLVQIKHIQGELKTTTVYVTHDQIAAMTLADRIVIMKKGAIHQISTPDQIHSDPSNTFAANLIGSLPINLIEGTLRGGVFTAPGVKVAGLPAKQDGNVTLGVSPKDCKVGGDSVNLSGSDYWVEPTGDMTFLTIKAGDKLFEVKAYCDYRADLDSEAHVRFAPASTYLFNSTSGQRLR